MQFGVCLPTSCQAQMALSEEMLQKMISGKKLIVAAVNVQQKTMVFLVPLLGFRKTWDGSAEWMPPNTRQPGVKCWISPERPQRSKGQRSSPALNFRSAGLPRRLLRRMLRRPYRRQLQRQLPIAVPRPSHFAEAVRDAYPRSLGGRRIVQDSGRGLWPGPSGAISGARPWPPRKIAMQKESPKGEAARTPVLTVKNVSYYYGSKQALDDVSFDVFPGRVTALLGPNGAGKTTLFSLITRLFDAPTGRIEICGRSAAEWGARALGPLGVVFQQPTLDLDLTVKQNLRYFAALRGLKRKDADERMMRALDALDMAERVKERVRALNGGHRRRVEIARALLHSPKLLLLDEPTIGLDVPTRTAIVRHIHELARTDNIGVLWATHLFDEVEPDDDLLVLNKGRIVARGVAKDVVAETGAGDLGGAFRLLIGGDTEEDIAA